MAKNDTIVTKIKKSMRRNLEKIARENQTTIVEASEIANNLLTLKKGKKVMRKKTIEEIKFG